jgi:hypothetical protein
MEILVVLEGQCTTTGQPVQATTRTIAGDRFTPHILPQARHSYSYNAGDILFDSMFDQVNAFTTGLPFIRTNACTDKHMHGQTHARMSDCVVCRQNLCKYRTYVHSVRV